MSWVIFNKAIILMSFRACPRVEGLTRTPLGLRDPGPVFFNFWNRPEREGFSPPQNLEETQGILLHLLSLY